MDIMKAMRGLKRDLKQLLPGQFGFCTDTEELFIGNGDGNANIQIGAKGEKGNDGVNGVTYTPNVSIDGILSWTNDGGKTNPVAVNLKGSKGDKGDKGADAVIDTEFSTTSENAIANRVAALAVSNIRNELSQLHEILLATDEASKIIFSPNHIDPDEDIAAGRRVNANLGDVIVVINRLNAEIENLRHNDDTIFTLSQTIPPKSIALCKVTKDTVTGATSEDGSIEVTAIF